MDHVHHLITLLKLWIKLGDKIDVIMEGGIQRNPYIKSSSIGAKACAGGECILCTCSSWSRWCGKALGI